MARETTGEGARDGSDHVAHRAGGVGALALRWVGQSAGGTFLLLLLSFRQFCVSSPSRFRPLCSPQIGDRSANQKSRKLLKFQDGPRPRINEPEKSHWCARPNLTFSTWTRRFMNFPGYAFSRRPQKSASDRAASHSEVHTHGTVKMAAIAISTPSWPVPPWSLAARASPPARPSRPPRSLPSPSALAT